MPLCRDLMTSYPKREVNARYVAMINVDYDYDGYFAAAGKSSVVKDRHR